MDIFVSYTVRDGLLNAQKLGEICHLLSPSGNVFIDLLHNSDPDPPAEWRRRLATANVVVLCCTPGILASPWVRLELAFVFAARKPLVLWTRLPGDRPRSSLLEYACRVRTELAWIKLR
jgi:hypothetical protein